MALFRGIQEYIALDANNITLVFDLGNIVNISGNIFLYPPQGHPILYKYYIKVSCFKHYYNFLINVPPFKIKIYLVNLKWYSDSMRLYYFVLRIVAEMV